MAQYLILLHEQPSDFSDVSPDEIQTIIAEYTAWRDGLIAKGKHVGSQKLKDEGGKNLRVRNGALEVVDGPYAEAKEVVGGYFVVEAASYDEAVELSQDCPHLKYGGRIELREIDATH